MQRCKFWGITIIMFALSLADIVLTYIGTPDLRNEGNPVIVLIHENWGLGWHYIIFINIIIFFVLTTMAYYRFIKINFIRYPIMAKNIFHYALLIHTKEHSMYGFVFSCFLSFPVVIFVRIFAVVGWLSIIVPNMFPWSGVGNFEWDRSGTLVSIPFFDPLISRWGEAMTLIVVLALLFSLTLYIFWFSKEWRANKILIQRLGECYEQKHITIFCKCVWRTKFRQGLPKTGGCLGVSHRK
ncbi:MAG: hypothetical protein FWC16_09130 [Defluviitaleaceae bacterium]|nr:hypothetical protein [Defluviitaleaceae bacterium]MCL2275073.1 hypothetical protein [Defluviitaleaceae bacterium]